MATKFTEIELSEFGDRIGFANGRLLDYLDTYFNYYRDEYPLMVRFFLGELNKVNANVFNDLLNLIKEAEHLANAISSNDYILFYLKDWQIVDYLEDLRIELYRLTKTSKFLRSSKTNTNFSGTIEFTYPLGQEKTIEDVAKEVMGSDNYDEDMVDIAARNDLSEVDYDLGGGKNLILQVQLVSANSDVNSVVDNISGDKIYGKDLDKKIKFEDDDLRTLSYQDTIFQAVFILSNLIKGDHPEFKDFGRSNTVGTSTNLATSPSVFRELAKVFSSDDTLTNFTIENMEIDKGITQLSFSVNARLELIIKQNINI